MSKHQKPTHKAQYFVPIIIVVGILAISLGLYGYSLINHATPIGINQISNSTGETTLTFSPTSISNTVGSDSTLTLTADAGNARLTIVTVDLTYDPDKISTPVLTLGTFLPNQFSAPVVGNGKIKFTVAASPDSGGVTGSGTLATIAFKTTQTGSSMLSFTSNTLSASLNADKTIINSNTLKTATDVTITGNAAVAAATATPTPTPVPTSTTVVVNNIVTTTQTPKPTTKPVVKTPSPVAQNVSDTPAYTPDYTSNTSNNLIPITTDSTGTVTDTRVPASPNFFQKILLGWGIIFKFILSLFGIH